MATNERDGTLAAAVARGEPGAAEELFELVFDAVYRLARSRLRGDHHAAQEIVSDSLAAGLRGLPRFRAESSLPTWFCRIAERKIIDRKRREASLLAVGGNGELEALLAARPPPEGSALRRLADEETRSIVRQTLASLPDRHREILEWKYYEDSSLRQVADRLGVSPKSAERRLARARARLASALRQRGFRA